MPAAGVAAVQIKLAALATVDVVLREGATLGAKVLERRGAHGLLLLAGAPVVAQLPDGVAEGAWLRLRVLQAGAERITLQLLPDAPGSQAAPAATAQPPAAAYALALPGGATARLLVDRDPKEGQTPVRSGAGGVTLRFDSPVLGRLDLRIAPGHVAVHASAGAPADAARAAAGELRAAIQAATGAPAQVTVHPRAETLDVRG